MIGANEIRQTFLEFFAGKGHQVLPSAPIVVKNDPTLLFVNSGMAPFKDIFLGNSTVKFPRVADTQKCLRVSGKHNDLEEVGIDTYHHTMFEMLGNWSFGDYFKTDAIAWAWELLTEKYKIDKNRIYVTVFEGDKKENLDFDQEAFDLWKQHIDETRILRGNKKDNFWEMGDQGPCGPCSEIHVDCRTDEEREKVDGKTLVNNDHPQVIEIWNLVFMQFQRMADRSLVPLPARHVDTGMGFERLVRVLQQKNSNYDTDIFQPIIQQVGTWCNKKYGINEKDDIAMRVIADHIRTITFTIADGQLPGNVKAGYVIRRILRRAVRYGYTFLDLKEPFLCRLVPVVAEQFKDVFPEVKKQEEFIGKVILEEENSFLRTLDIGLKKLDDIIRKNKEAQSVISGKVAFELYDTYGFPLDLTQLILRENGMEMDQAGFDEEMKAQKDRARNATAIDTEDWIAVSEADTSVFVGYDMLECEMRILKYRKVKAKGEEFFQVVFDQTPFYAESGGQVGDTGTISNASGSWEINDTKKENNLTVHIARTLPNSLEGTFTAKVNDTRRERINGNHSATHLIHAALKNVLGTHVNQKGSLVNDEYLRFDVTHFQKMNDEELERVETMVNEKIRNHIALEELRNVPIDEARDMGAMALFGEKYGDKVRVIIFDKRFSIELCGGTHVKNTSQIGFCKIITESAVAAGVRRIEAITGEKAMAWLAAQEKELQQVKALLNNPKDAGKSVQQLQEEVQSLRKKIEKLEEEQVKGIIDDFKTRFQDTGNYNVLIREVNVPSAEALKNLTLALKQATKNSVCVLGAIIDGKPLINVAVSDSLVEQKIAHAGNMVKELSKEIKGGGGGQAGYASAGGSDPKGIPGALQKAATLLNINTTHVG